MNNERRSFIKYSLFAFTATGFATVFGGLSGLSRRWPLTMDSAQAAAANPPAGETPVDAAADPVAQAVGYKPNKKDVDVKRYPQAKKPDFKTQSCKTCSLYTKVDDHWGKCQLITSGVVASDGWCGSYSKKA